MIILSRKASFSAAHCLANPEFDHAKNLQLFGDCSNPSGHGHNYSIEVKVAGVPDRDTGFVADLSKLKTVIHEIIVKKCDHKNLNTQVDFLKGVIPTVENLAEKFYEQLLPEIKKITRAGLYSVMVKETENNYAEYRSKIESCF
ncbi:MAG: 6-carboxytetrahydropterin synthase [Deltaproteobacteria bacterium]|nr:6-carboxytetrahydropterin synthase [Deltaproteobacteria bacterium]